jgi:hypothetical protein
MYPKCLECIAQNGNAALLSFDRYRGQQQRHCELEDYFVDERHQKYFRRRRNKGEVMTSD